METMTITKTISGKELRKWCCEIAQRKNPILGVEVEAKKLYDWLAPVVEEDLELNFRIWCYQIAHADNPKSGIEEEAKKLYDWLTSDTQ